MSLSLISITTVAISLSFLAVAALRPAVDLGCAVLADTMPPEREISHHPGTFVADGLPAGEADGFRPAAASVIVGVSSV
jgi:hypothetical protein